MQKTEKERLERYEKKKITKLQHKTQAKEVVTYHAQRGQMKWWERLTGLGSQKMTSQRPWGAWRSAGQSETVVAWGMARDKDMR